jgi:hypothetical protein
MPKSLARYSAYEAVNVQELSYNQNGFAGPAAGKFSR